MSLVHESETDSLHRFLTKLLCLRKPATRRSPRKKSIETALPYELVEVIVREAWCTTTTENRWDLFRSISTLSHLWRTVLLDVALRYVFFESPLDSVAYRDIIMRHLASHAHSKGDVYHLSLFRHASVSIVVDLCSNVELAKTTELIPDARFIEFSIGVDRRNLFNSLIPSILIDRPSLTHLRLCWPPLGFSFPSPPTTVQITTVTHLHIPRHPYASLNTVLSLFPSVTHLRLGTPCFLKDLVPYMSRVQVLTLDAPPYCRIAGRTFPNSIPLWNVIAALENGLLQGPEITRGGRKGKIIMNAGVLVSDEISVTELIEHCAAHDVDFECRRIYSRSVTQPVTLESGHWDYTAWS